MILDKGYHFEVGHIQKRRDDSEYWELRQRDTIVFETAAAAMGSSRQKSNNKAQKGLQLCGMLFGLDQESKTPLRPSAYTMMVF